MVKGIEIFKAHFHDYRDRYVLIGGTACDLVMTDAGGEFRATKDLDIILCIEAFDAEFAKAFWAFVKQGGYEVREKSKGGKEFYRFQKPANDDYPFMLELFSRLPDVITVPDDCHLTPIPVDAAISSLSAILMDDDYYAFIRGGVTEIDGLTTIGVERIIPLKAKAWFDLRARQEAGEEGQSRHIKKHRNDVFRLYVILEPDRRVSLEGRVRNDMEQFISQVSDETIDLKAMGIKGQSLDEVLTTLTSVYGLRER